MLHEIVELVKAVAWPSVALYFLVKFRREIAQLLTELPNAVRRVRSAHGLGLKLEFDLLEGYLSVTEREAHHLRLKHEPEPKPGQELT